MMPAQLLPRQSRSTEPTIIVAPCRLRYCACMEYVDIERAIGLPGLRLVLTGGVPGPWGEAAKAIFHIKKIPYVAVRQTAGADDQALLRWTRQSSAPAAMYDKERPRTGWAEILFLAERLTAEPPLIPKDNELRPLFFGLCHELCGEQGLGWSRRLMLLDPLLRESDDDPPNLLGWKYGYSPTAADAAVDRTRVIIDSFAERLRRQHDNGSRFLIGDDLTALDIYWATFTALLVPLPEEVCPMPEWMRPMYDLRNHPSNIAIDPLLLKHRNFIYDEFLPQPMDF